VLAVETLGVGNVEKSSVDLTIYLMAEKRQRQRKIIMRIAAARVIKPTIVLEGIIVIVPEDGEKKDGLTI
jgi:hypothetical protein